MILANSNSPSSFIGDPVAHALLRAASRLVSTPALGRCYYAGIGILLISLALSAAARQTSDTNAKAKLQAAQAAARANPSEDNLFHFGSALLQYHAYVQGLKIFRYATQKYPRSAKLQVGLGVAEYSTGDYREAVETLCRAVDLDPSDRRALGFLGKMIGVAPGLSVEVRRRLEHFAKLYPHNPAANYYYALSLPQTPETNRQAETLLREAVAEDPKFAEAHYHLGLIYQQKKLDTKAAREFESAVRLKPDLKSAHYRLAQIYAKEGRAAKARQEYATVRSLNKK
jgi:tetratricopeptide (TPR) repeat protein